MNERERVLAISALWIAADQHYYEAWRLYGPEGATPKPALHTSLITLGRQCAVLASKLSEEDAEP